ncbi:hypothetical protein ACOCJ5_10300 [Knoellia sp. CPCC 206450]|uniref:hypothetical protein n=1 Tax=Knoellia tibetensis TaxID=3404798 RepID=UPI003B434F80
MQIAVKPHVLKDIVLKIEDDEYEAHVSSARLTPSTETPVLKWQGMTPSALHVEAGSVTTDWAFAINAAQDWETADSLTRYLFDNAGQVKDIVLTPQRGKGTSFAFRATIVPSEIGGDVNTVAVSPVTMPVDGTPVPSPVVVAP